MKGDKFMDSLNHIDEGLVSDAEKIRHKKSQKNKVWKKVIAAAACLCLVVSAVVIAPRYKSDISFPNGNLLSINQKSYLIAGAVYPELTKYPSNEYDEKAYDEWFDARQERMELLKVHKTDGLEFFEKTAAKFLSCETENSVYSPMNVYFALSILAETTDGNSRQQILDLLCVDSMDELRASANALWNVEYKDDSSGKCLLANSLWLSDSVLFNKATLQTVADNYYTSSFSGNMSDEKFNKARQTWINEQTDGLLKDSVESLNFDPETVMSLVSTINFKAKWSDEFNSKNTFSDTFHSNTGDTKCEYMYMGGHMGRYCWGENFTAVPMSLAKSGEMWFILPDEGTTPQELLNSVEVMNMLFDMDNEYEKSSYPMIELTVPKFDTSSDTDLKKTLKNVGITDVFDFEKSDFSPLREENGQEIVISSAQHSARVTIDEEGVTAAAFTSIDYNGAGTPQDYVKFTVDRPFLFVITGQGNMPLFVGIINQP